MRRLPPAFFLPPLYVTRARSRRGGVVMRLRAAHAYVMLRLSFFFI